MSKRKAPIETMEDVEGFDLSLSDDDEELIQKRKQQQQKKKKKKKNSESVASASVTNLKKKNKKKRKIPPTPTDRVEMIVLALRSQNSITEETNQAPKLKRMNVAVHNPGTESPPTQNLPQPTLVLNVEDSPPLVGDTLANFVQSSDSNTIAEEAVPTEMIEAAALNSPPMLGVHPLVTDTPTANEPTEATNELPQTDVANATMDVTLSEVAPLHDAAEPSTLFNVNGYRVRQEFVATAKKILGKHGDILAGTSFEGSLLHSQLLKNVCAIYQKLEKSKFSDFTLPELESMLHNVYDFGKLNVDVSWLAKRLDDICDAKKMLQLSASIRDEKSQNLRIVAELGKELEMQKAAMQKIQAEIQDTERKLETEKAKSETLDQTIMGVNRKVQDFQEKSLVDGI